MQAMVVAPAPGAGTAGSKERREAHHATLVRLLDELCRPGESWGKSGVMAGLGELAGWGCRASHSRRRGTGVRFRPCVLGWVRVSCPPVSSHHAAPHGAAFCMMASGSWVAPGQGAAACAWGWGGKAQGGMRMASVVALEVLGSLAGRKAAAWPLQPGSSHGVPHMAVHACPAFAATHTCALHLQSPALAPCIRLPHCQPTKH